MNTLQNQLIAHASTLPDYAAVPALYILSAADEYIPSEIVATLSNAIATRHLIHHLPESLARALATIVVAGSRTEQDSDGLIADAWAQIDLSGHKARLSCECALGWFVAVGDLLPDEGTNGTMH